MCGYIYHFVLLMGWCVCGGCAVGTHETNHGDGFSRARSMEILSRPKTAHTYSGYDTSSTSVCVVGMRILASTVLYIESCTFMYFKGVYKISNDLRQTNDIDVSAVTTCPMRHPIGMTPWDVIADHETRGKHLKSLVVTRGMYTYMRK